MEAYFLVKVNIHSLFNSGLVSTASREKTSWLFSCWMLHFVYQLVFNFVCLLFGAQQVVCSGFIRAFLWKPPAAAGNNADESSETEPN